jgi:hypothetical protein
MLKAKPKRARIVKKAPVKSRSAAPSRPEPTHVITLNPADSRELRKMLDCPAREPNAFMKAIIADHRRLIQAK